MLKKKLFLFSFPEILLDIGDILFFDIIPLLRLLQAEPRAAKADEHEQYADQQAPLCHEIEATKSQKGKENRIPRLDQDIEPLRYVLHESPSPLPQESQ
ncbi:hypothetical protein [Mitsuokella multacida]|uniref:hypothetical protein n=1 Tax=Mitsuokella multacida TaxID=52226 RepID=UPI001F377E42|nr:hypothetical protein [Mitsuokella multacida]MCF2584885.1 hypothetical protein [Mitsuokella multacida]